MFPPGMAFVRLQVDRLGDSIQVGRHVHRPLLQLVPYYMSWPFLSIKNHKEKQETDSNPPPAPPSWRRRHLAPSSPDAKRALAKPVGIKQANRSNGGTKTNKNGDSDTPHGKAEPHQDKSLVEGQRRLESVRRANKSACSLALPTARYIQYPHWSKNPSTHRAQPTASRSYATWPAAYLAFPVPNKNPKS